MKMPVRSSFRLQLALQTTLVAGLVIASFGTAAWWFARSQQSHNQDLDIKQEARQLWVQLTPRHRSEDIRSAAEFTFAEAQTPVAVAVMWHYAGNEASALMGPDLQKIGRERLRQYLPQGPEVVTEPLGPASGARPGRALTPQPGQAGIRRRPVMPEICEPQFFTVADGQNDWRYGSFSSPHYTVFVGLSMEEMGAESRKLGFWFVVAGVMALFMAGVGAWWTSGRAIRPLKRIVTMANRMSAGRLDERIPLSAGDDGDFTQLINALNAMTERLKDSFEQAARFTADASHELKTPLAVMQASLNDALRTESLDEETRERIALVLHQLARLNHVTHSLLLLSQADAGELPVNRERYDLSADLEGLREDAEALCEAAELKLETDLASKITVEADRALLNQVFQNLLSNAVKHNHKGGRVKIRLFQSEGFAIFEIVNDCRDVTEKEKERLFERFYRVEDSRQGEGFGLGLNIAFELAKANSACLQTATSEPGTICFQLRLTALSGSNLD